VGLVKTERSDAPLPLAEAVNQAFLALRARSLFSHDEDWVFASERSSGKRPMNSKFIQQETFIEAGKAIGLDFNLGWHTFRHSYKVLLERAGTDVTVQRDLMRHANTNTTMNVYGEIEMDRMRNANNKAVALAFGEDAH
jgi:integrase